MKKNAFKHNSHSERSEEALKHKAFTLAEVLITLTIIGVIAALTIPNLMQSWRKHERISEIKTAYSIIQNAVKMSIAENGNPEGWVYTNCYDFSNTYILPYLKIQKKCGYSGTGYKALNSGCFLDNGKNGTWNLLNNSTSDNGQGGYTSKEFYTLKLQNGMDLAIWAPLYVVKEQHNLYQLILFVFDVNGKSGPTLAGNDVFTFKLNLHTSQLDTMGAGGNYSSGLGYINNSNSIQDILNSDTFGCNKTATAMAGMGCARILESNHWEFPDDYPIKKF